MVMVPSTLLAKDLRKLRSNKYTPAAENEARAFVEGVLGERLPAGDLLEALKDGVALCKLVNQAAPNTLRFKVKAQMPFVQMENIALFLEACKCPPFNLQSHDIFLTVDLFESKDPAQVLVCLGAFSRALHKIDPIRFPHPIGARLRTSPQGAEPSISVASGNKGKYNSNVSNNLSIGNHETRPKLTQSKTGDSCWGGSWSPTKSNALPSSSRFSTTEKILNEGAKSPPWSIAQYGYLCGASQGKLGVSFGGRRQITSAGPYIPRVAENDKRLMEKEHEKKKLLLKTEESQRQLEFEISAKERARFAEEKKLLDKAEKTIEEKFLRAEEENKKWEQKDRGWRLQEEEQLKQDHEFETRMIKDQNWSKSASNSRLSGQYYTQYQVQSITNESFNPESNRIKELERELELARKREREYERSRQVKISQKLDQKTQINDLTGSVNVNKESQRSSKIWRPLTPSCNNSDEIRCLEKQKSFHKQQSCESSLNPPYDFPNQSKSRSIPQRKSPRPLPEPQISQQIPKQQTGSRPLPDPAKYAKTSCKSQIQTDPSTCNLNQPQQPQTPLTSVSKTSPCHNNSQSGTEDRYQQRYQQQSQPQVKSGGWALKGLLEREMEMERQRQREWEESQRELKGKFVIDDRSHADRDEPWDLNQWNSYNGSDSQNIGSQGIGAGSRQIVGPRPPPTSR